MIETDIKQITTNDPHAVANYLASLNAGDVDGVAIMVPDSPQVRDAITRLSSAAYQSSSFFQDNQGIGCGFCRD